MADGVAAQGSRLAFLAYVQGQNGNSGRGALLVTDEATRPLEFRCTTAIQPNALQRILYGETLRSYIAADLVGEPLLDALQEKPSVVIVTEPLFLRLRAKANARMVCLRRQGEQISTVAGEDERQGKREAALLSCASGRFQPLVITGPPDYGDELEVALGLLRPIFSTADLLEPFERIEKVVAELDRQDASSVDRPKPR